MNIQYLIQISNNISDELDKLRTLSGGVHADYARHCNIAITDLEGVEDRLKRAVEAMKEELRKNSGQEVR